MELTSALPQDSVDAYAEILLLANTPSYLWRRIPEVHNFSELGQRFSPAELASEIVRIDEQSDYDFNALAAAYAALVFLLRSHQEPHAFRTRTFQRLVLTPSLLLIRDASVAPLVTETINFSVVA